MIQTKRFKNAKSLNWNWTNDTNELYFVYDETPTIHSLIILLIGELWTRFFDIEWLWRSYLPSVTGRVTHETVVHNSLQEIDSFFIGFDAFDLFNDPRDGLVTDEGVRR